MKIGVDARLLLIPIFGVGRYIKNVIESLEKVKKYGDELIYFWGPVHQETDYIIDKFDNSGADGSPVRVLVRIG